MPDRTDKGIAWQLDPRTKIFALIAACIATALCRDAFWGSALFACTLAFAAATGRPRLAAKFLVAYAAILGFVALVMYASPEIGARVALIFQSLRAAFPAFLMAALLVTTTKTGDLVAALYAFHLPRSLVIPLAVGIRFFPTFAEEFRSVRDAARLQGLHLSPAGVATHPVAMCESLLVPTMLRSAKIAEELAAAAVARGIEKPGSRTSFNPLTFSKADIVLLIAFCAACAAVSVARYAFQGVAL